MKSKREIENQLAHFRTDCPQSGTAENEIWIRALEWVLGDLEHQANYALFIKELHTLVLDANSPRATTLALGLALDRLE